MNINYVDLNHLNGQCSSGLCDKSSKLSKGNIGSFTYVDFPS